MSVFREEEGIKNGMEALKASKETAQPTVHPFLQGTRERKRTYRGTSKGSHATRGQPGFSQPREVKGTSTEEAEDREMFLLIDSLF